jgi:hypothetical protein
MRMVVIFILAANAIFILPVIFAALGASLSAKRGVEDHR